MFRTRSEAHKHTWPQEPHMCKNSCDTQRHTYAYTVIYSITHTTIADIIAHTITRARPGQEVVNTPAHQQLAKEAADQSLVLLKNDKSTLPLKGGRGTKLAVIGRNANATTNMQGNYFGTAPYLISPWMGA